MSESSPASRAQLLKLLMMQHILNTLKRMTAYEVSGMCFAFRKRSVLLRTRAGSTRRVNVPGRRQIAF